MEQSLVGFWHSVFGEQVFVIAEADVGLPRRGPEIQSPFAFDFGVLRIIGKVRRVIRAQQKRLALKHQVRFGGFDGVDDGPLGLGFLDHAVGNFAAVGPVGFDFDACVLGLESLDHAFVGIAGKRGVPSHLAFRFGAGIEHLFAVFAVIGDELGDGGRFARLRRHRVGAKD